MKQCFNIYQSECKRYLISHRISQQRGSRNNSKTTSKILLNTTVRLTGKHTAVKQKKCFLKCYKHLKDWQL